MARPGFGEPHPQLATLLRDRRPLATQRTAWANGTLPLEIRAYAGAAELPDELVTSVRCIVGVGDCVLVCTNEGGAHPWPGGRRESGESCADTAIREVHEETGWWLEPEELRLLGWLHLHHLAAPPADYPYPHPDFVQLVYAANAKRHDGDPHAAWTDVAGYERSSMLVRIEEAREQLAGDPLASAFLELLPQR